MKMKYFAECATAEQLKKLYYKLCVQNHPDHGGDVETMKEINAEYEAAFEMLKSKHVNAKGETYEKETEEKADTFENIINALAILAGVHVEICGSWIWCTGETKAHKEELKQMHFRWSKTKQAWYFHEGKYKKHNGNEKTMDEIRFMFGSDEFQAGQEAFRAANRLS